MLINAHSNRKQKKNNKKTEKYHRCLSPISCHSTVALVLKYSVKGVRKCHKSHYKSQNHPTVAISQITSLPQSITVIIIHIQLERLWNQKKTKPKEYIMQIKMTPRKLTSFYLFSRFHVQFFFNCCLSECDTTGRPKPQFAGFRKPVRKELYINYPRGNCIVQCLVFIYP